MIRLFTFKPIHLALFGISLLGVAAPRASFALPNEVGYRMEVELDTKTDQIHGTEHVTVTNRTGKTLTELYFHMYPNAFRWEKDSTFMTEMKKFENPDSRYLQAGKGSWIKIESLFEPPLETQLIYKITQELMSISLPRKLLNNEKITLDIHFITQLAPIAERSGVWDGNYAVAQWFPKLMVYDQDGWALKHNAGYHFIGEFYGDFGTYDVEITVPENMKVGATGHRMNEISTVWGKKTYVYHAENVHDFAWVGDERYVEETLQAGPITIHVLTRSPESKVIGEYAKNSILYHEKRVGPYPYADFTIATTYYNGPMEYPQLVMMKSWPTALSRWVERDFLSLWESTVFHETGHQWFFGMIGNNEVKDAWLDEGFETYFEESYLHDAYGEKENIFRMFPWAKLTNSQFFDAIWRSQQSDIDQPIQTPSYEFRDPFHYFASEYYKVGLFGRYFDSMVGREKFDRIFKEYYKRMLFKNARPEDWYQVVEDLSGKEPARWWKDWIQKNLRSDYSVTDLKTEKASDGTFVHHFTVRQEGEFYAPVDVLVKGGDEKGNSNRYRADISESRHEVDMIVTTPKPLEQLEVDPDHVAPDLERFNNTIGFFPKIKIWPITTHTLNDDAVTVIPAPYFLKRPGIGPEAGVFLATAHYLDWMGYGFFGRDFRHNSFTVNSTFQTYQPELDWGWSIHVSQDVLSSRGSLLANKSFGPEVGHDPQNQLKFGSEYFGNLGDEHRALGLAAEYSYLNLANGRDFRYALTIHNSIEKNLNSSGGFDRFFVDAETRLALGHRASLNLRGILGTTVGEAGQSSLFDLQAEEEGKMRFDNIDIGLYKVKSLKAGTIELQLPLPYSGWTDGLGFIHGPTWEWHIFADFSNGAQSDAVLVDCGLGTRFEIATGGYGRLGLNFEIIPFQNATQPASLQFPLFLLSLSTH